MNLYTLHGNLKTKSNGSLWIYTHNTEIWKLKEMLVCEYMHTTWRFETIEIWKNIHTKWRFELKTMLVCESMYTIWRFENMEISTTWRLEKICFNWGEKYQLKASVIMIFIRKCIKLSVILILRLKCIMLKKNKYY